MALLVSLTAHVGLALILASWVFVANQASQALWLDASQEAVVLPAFEMLPNFESPDNVDAQFAAASLADPATPKPTPLSIDDIQMTWKDEHALESDSTLLTTSILKTVAAEISAHQGREGASFFGAYAPGNRFVFVLDSSSSMEGERWNFARSKLLQSLRALGTQRQFFIICFDSQTTLLFDCQPESADYLSADSVTVRRVERWLRSRVLGNATMPAQALQFALHLKPDAIFLLSDGELQDHSVYMLKSLNSGRGENPQVPIHTVLLQSPVGKATLQQVASENGGSFTEIQGGQARR